MSAKLFLLQTFGKIKPTEKTESEFNSLFNDYNKFIEIEKSGEPAKFRELEKWAGSEAFRNLKKEVEALKFKGSKEYQQLREYKKLSGASSIRLYLAEKDGSNLKRFESLKKSQKLTDYFSLKEFVEGGAFLKEKKEAESKVFKGSSEEKQLAEFTKLAKSKAIKAYFEMVDSPRLKEHEKFQSSPALKRFFELKGNLSATKDERKEFVRLKKDAGIRSFFRFEKSIKLKYYREMSGSKVLARYEELKKLVKSDDFIKRKAYLEDRKKFEKTEAWKKKQQYTQLAADNDIRFYLSYKKSKAYKNYLTTDNSPALKRYYELKELTASKEFIERKAYLEDPKKWEKTEEYARQQKFIAMKKQPDIALFLKYDGKHDFDFFRTHELAIDEKFASKPGFPWSVQSYWAAKTGNENFSQPGDLQNFSSGKNLATGKNGLILQVKKQKSSGAYWNPSFGFMPKDFEYTSDLLSTGNNFWLENGTVEAKIIFNPVPSVASFFSLFGQTAMPQANLLEMGAKNRLGFYSTNGTKPVFNGISVSGLKKGIPYIFGIEKDGDKITWKINGKAVYNWADKSFKTPMHLSISSIVVNEIPSVAMPVNFEIAWARCFRKK